MFQQTSKLRANQVGTPNLCAPYSVHKWPGPILQGYTIPNQQTAIFITTTLKWIKKYSIIFKRLHSAPHSVKHRFSDFEVVHCICCQSTVVHFFSHSLFMPQCALHRTFSSIDFSIVISIDSFAIVPRFHQQI